MATGTKLSNAAAIAACDAIVDLVDGGAGAGHLKIYSAGSGVPAGVDVAISDQVLLADITLNDPAFGAAADANPGGRATLDVDPAISDSSANDTGTAAFFRYCDSTGTAVIQGTCGTSDADLILNTTSLVSGAAVSITSATFTVPEA